MLKSKGYTDEQIESIFKLGETATNAATKVKTFTQLMDTLKEAAQSGWTQTWEYIIGDFEGAKTLWTSVSDTLGELIGRSADSRNKLVKGAMFSNWDKLVEKINDAGIETSTFEERTKSVLEKHGYVVEDIIKKHGSLEEAFRSGALSSDLLMEAIDGLSGSMVDLSSVQKDLKKGDTGEDVKKIQQRLKDLGYDLGKWDVDGIIGSKTEEAIKKFQELNGLEVTGIVDEATLKALEGTVDGVNELRESVKGLVDDITKRGGRELLISAFKNIWEAIQRIIGPIKRAWREIFPKTTSEQLYNLIEGFEKFTSKLKLNSTQMINLKKTFKGLFAILDVVKTLVGGGITGAFRLLSKILGAFDLNILDVTASIGDALVKFRDWIFDGERLNRIFSALAEGISIAYNAIRDWISAFIKLPKVQSAITKFRNAFTKTFGGVIDKFKEFANLIKNFGKWVTLDDGTLKKVGFKEIGDFFKENVIGALKKIDIKKFFNNIVDSLKSFRDGAKKYLEDAGVNFEELKDKILDFVNGVKEVLGNNLGSIIAIGILLTFLLLIKKLLKVFEMLVHPIDTVADCIKGLGKVFKDTVGKYLKSAAIKNIATSIIMIAGAIAILAMLDQGKVWSSVGAIGALFALMTILSKMLTKMEDPKQFTKMSLAIIEIGGALALIALAIKILGGMSLGEVVKGGITVAAFLGIMVVMMKATKYLEKNMIPFSKAMISISASLIILSIAVKILGGMETGKLIRGGIAVATFMLLMIPIMAASRLLKKDMPSFGKTMLLLSASLLILSIVVKQFGKMGNAVLVKGAVAILAFLLLMIPVMAASKLIKKDMSSFGKAMLGIGVGLLAMALVIKILSGMDMAEIAKGGIVITAFIGIIAAMALVTRLISKDSSNIVKFGVTMLAFSASILIIVGAIALLSLISEEDIKKAVSAIGKLTLMFATILVASKFATTAKGTIIALAIAIGIIAVSLAALSLVKADKLESAVKAMSIVIGMFALLVGSTHFMKGSLPAMISMMGAVLILAGVLYLLSTLEVKDTLTNATALSILLLALSGALVIASRAGPFALKSVGALAVMLLVVGGLAVILGLLSHFDAQPSIETAAALSILLLAMSGALFILSAVGATGPAALIGMGLLGVFIIGLGALIAGIGWLATKIPELESFLDKGIPILEKIGIGLGSFFGGIIAGFAEGAMGALPEIATDLSTFMTNLQPFLDGVKGMDDSVTTGMGALVDVILKLTAASVLDAIASWLTGGSSLADFAAQLVPFGEGLKEFSNSISDLSDESLSKMGTIAGAIDGLVEIADKVPETGGLVQKITGVPNLTNFAMGLINLGLATKLFSMSISSLTDEDISKMTDIGTAIDKFAEIADKVPETGGWVQKIAGVPDLVSFATGLTKLGPAISTFNSSIASMTTDDADKISSIGTAIDGFATIANKIPEEGGWLQKITGVPSLCSFAIGLVSLGASISLFNLSVSGMKTEDIDKIDAIGNVIDSFATIANKIPEEGGWLDKITGVKDLGTFAEHIGTLGTKIKEFSEKVKDVTDDDINKLSKIGSAANVMVNMATKLKDYEGGEWFNTNLPEFAGQIKEFASNLDGFDELVTNIDETQISSIADSSRVMLSLATDLSDFDESGCGKFKKGVGNIGSGLKDFNSKIADIDVSNLSNSITQISRLKTLVIDLSGLGDLKFDNFAIAIDRLIESLSNTGELSSAGEKIVSSLASGITDSASSLKDALNQICIDAYATTAAMSALFAPAGTLMMTSLASGISKNSGAVLTAFSAIIKLAAFAIKFYKGEFTTAGFNLGIGFANGIKSSEFMAKLRAKALAKAALNAAKEALNEHSPSKEAYKVGAFFGKGFTNGIDAYAKNAVNSGREIAESAKTGLSNAISKVGALVENGIDSQPTIRPVLDLSDVESGAGTINGMFGMTPSIKTLSNVGAISSMMNRSQNGANDDVISAIESLGKRIGNISGDTYQINGVTYDDGSNVTDAVRTIVRAARIERRR